MPPLSAWGLLGDTLTGGANAYLKARNELPLLQDQYDEVAFRKQIRPLELEQARQRFALQQSQVLKNLAGISQPEFHSLKNGQYLMYYPDTGKVELGGRDVGHEGDPIKSYGSIVLQAMEQKIGHPQPWSYEELSSPDMQDLRDMLQKRSDIAITPDYAPMLRRTVRDAATPAATVARPTQPRAGGSSWMQALDTLGPQPNDPVFLQNYTKFLQGFLEVPQDKATAWLTSPKFAQLVQSDPQVAMAYKRAYIIRYQQPLPAGVP